MGGCDRISFGRALARRERPASRALVADLERSLNWEPTVKEIMGVAEKAGPKLPPAPHDARIYDLRHTFASVGTGGACRSKSSAGCSVTRK